MADCRSAYPGPCCTIRSVVINPIYSSHSSEAIIDHLVAVQLHAKYNQWINQRLYDTAERLTDEERRIDQRAFFGSILGTFNHIVVGDSIWLRRFLDAKIPASESMKEETLQWLPEPPTLDAVLYPQWPELRAVREQIDAFILQWTDRLCSEDLDSTLNYTNTQGRPFARPLGPLLVNFFNHQTHHRGQVSTLLFQSGVDPELTDLLAVIPD